MVVVVTVAEAVVFLLIWFTVILPYAVTRYEHVGIFL